MLGESFHYYSSAYRSAKDRQREKECHKRELEKLGGQASMAKLLAAGIGEGKYLDSLCDNLGIMATNLSGPCWQLQGMRETAEHFWKEQQDGQRRLEESRLHQELDGLLVPVDLA